MKEFAFLSPPRIVFGVGVIAGVGNEVAAFGRRALVVTGARAMRASGALGSVMDRLHAAGVEPHLFDRVGGEPTLDTVDAGLAVAREKACGVVLGLGGGSALDAAKTIAALANKQAAAADYFRNGREIEGPGLPFVAAPTTSGTGAEITKNSVLTDAERGVKQSMRSPHMVAAVALVDPALTLSLPPDVTAHSGMDALTQAVECYVSRAANPISDALALAAVGCLMPFLERAVARGGDIAAREALSMGSLLTGMAFANAGLGAVHGLAHPLGVALGLPHGLVCAVLLPAVIDYNRPACAERVETLAVHMGIESGSRLADSIRRLSERIGIPRSFRGFGLAESHLPGIIKQCRSGSMRSNPREMSDADVTALMRSLM